MDAPMTIYSVTTLTQYIKSLFDGDATLAAVFVAGEISNLKYHSSGHIYFTLKDEQSVLRAVMFRPAAAKLGFRMADGMRVITCGRVSVFPGVGQYQLYAETMQPDGLGALYLAFEQLKEKLRTEGLFDPSLKRPLPSYPRRIALITSPTGAAVRDMLRILGRRYPLARVRIVPVLVQGPDAPGEIITALDFANRYRIADVIIAGRGGGSLEDLWAFNDEGVARAIRASAIPVISAVGHEPDVTIADFVADIRAATPSNAAELAVPDTTDILAGLSSTKAAIVRSVQSQISRKSDVFRTLSASRVLQNPQNTIDDRRMELAHKSDRLVAATQNALSRKREIFLRDVSKLDAMSPLKVLARGYAFAQDEQGAIVTDAGVLSQGDRLQLTLRRGKVLCSVDDITKEDSL
ncbi:MAG: exodeoxyribonuclease VII large subunit [Clostridiaceae bacterium]|nr:exodeoxyribonuclease VII large subunit [Clostridiaceae bacterium]